MSHELVELNYVECHEISSLSHIPSVVDIALHLLQVHLAKAYPAILGTIETLLIPAYIPPKNKGYPKVSHYSISSMQPESEPLRYCWPDVLPEPYGDTVEH